MINEQIFAVGSWQVELTGAAPVDLLDDLKHFGHVIFTESRVDPRLMSDTDMLAMSTYTGILRSRSPSETSFVIGGPGLLAWLGDEGGRSYIYEQQRTYTAQTFENSIDRSASIVMDGTPPGMIRDDSGNQLALRSGTIEHLAGTYSGKHYLMNPRQSLEYLMAEFESEWRVNYDGTIDFGQRSTLYTTTPSVIAVRKGSGSDPNWDGMTVSELQFDQDAAEYATKVVVARSGGSVAEGTVEVAEAVGSIDPDDPIESLDIHGGALLRVAIVNEPTATADNAQSLADKNLSNLNKLNATTRITLEDFDVSGGFDLGDTIYLYDTVTGHYDLDNSAQFRGTLYSPAAVRIVSMSRPITSVMGAYYRDSSGDYIDLTEYIVPEPSSVTVDVGDPLRNLLDQESPTILQSRTDDGGEFIDATVPKPPTNFTSGSEAYISEEGITLARIDTSWTAVTLNTDDSTVQDGSHYEVRWQQVSPQNMVPTSDANLGSWTTSPLWSKLNDNDDGTYVELVVT